MFRISVLACLGTMVAPALSPLVAQEGTATTFVRYTSMDNRVGIGLRLRKDATSDELLILTPLRGSPAHKAGLQAGDVIVEISHDTFDDRGKPLGKTEIISTRGKTIDSMVRFILGEPETKVRLKIRREGIEQPFMVEIARGRAEIESVFGVRRKDNADWDFVIDRKNKIGYIHLSHLMRTTYRDLEAAMYDLRSQRLKGLVLDLRFNPGGLLESAIKVTDLFIDDGLIVSIRTRRDVGSDSLFRGRHAGSLLDFPMVCLVNGDSVRSTEIVAAALQDHHRAKIIGVRSRGFGSMQNIRDIEVTDPDPKTGGIDRGAIKLTTATLCRPNGKNLDRTSSGKDNDDWGVTPDKIIPLTDRERRALAEYQRSLEIIWPRGKAKVRVVQDRQLDAAVDYLRGQIKTASR